MTTAAQEIWRKLEESKYYDPKKDTINWHSPPRVVPRYMLRGKSLEEVRNLLSQERLLFVPKNGHFTGTVKHKIRSA